MKKFYFSLLAMTLMVTPAAAAVCSYGTVYGSYLSYGGSDLKDDGWSSTAYLNVGDCNANALEIGLGTTTIHYNTRPDLDQKDFTIAYTNTNQLLSNQALRVGFHYIDSDDVLTDRGKIYFLKDTYTVYDDWNAGLEIAYSNYRHSSTKLGVIQFTPHYGVFLSAFNRRIYAETKLHYIHKDAGVGESIDNFYSMEQVLSLKEGNMDYKLDGWAGQQSFAVKNSGFVVYNLADRYLGGLGAEIGYNFANQMRLGLNINRQWLEHNGTNDRATLTMTTLTLGGRF